MANGVEWNKFILENNGLFLQSWEWGEFQKSLGRKIWRIGDSENWAALVVRHDLPLGKNYLYCPGGPTIVSSIKYNVSSIIGKFLQETNGIARQEKSIFLKIESFWPIRLASPKFQPASPSLGGRGEQALGKEVNIGENGSPAGEPFSQHWINLGFKKSNGGQRILETLVLDLNKTEEELLAEMKQKTRYNINLSQKRGVSVKVISNFQFPISKNCLAEFLKLMKITSERDKIKSHPENHYRKMVGIIPNDIFRLYVAEFDRKIIAANIVAFFGKRATYLHGASSNEYRNLMAPYLLQWEQIKEAKKRGCEIYDFWGIDENKWPGVTRFKKGFGGREIEYIGAFDYVFDRKWYFLYNLARRIKKC